MSQIETQNALEKALASLPESIDGNLLVRLAESVASPKEQSLYRTDESYQAIANKVVELASFITKLDALEVYGKLQNHTLDAAKAKINLNLTHFLTEIKSARNIYGIIRSAAEFMLKNEVDTSEISRQLKGLLGSNASPYHYHFEPIVTKTTEVSEILDVYIASSKYAPEIYAKLFDYEAQLLASDRERIEMELGYHVRVHHLYLSEPMIDALMPTISLPIDLDPLHIIESGRKLSETYSPTIEIVAAERFTAAQLQELKNSSGTIAAEDLSASLKVFTRIEEDHNQALMSYREKLNPLLDRIRAHLPFTHNEFSLMVATLDDAILSEVFDRNKIISQLVSEYDHQVADVLKQPISTLITLVVSEWLVQDGSIATFSILKDERY